MLIKHLLFVIILVTQIRSSSHASDQICSESMLYLNSLITTLSYQDRETCKNFYGEKFFFLENCHKIESIVEDLRSCHSLTLIEVKNNLNLEEFALRLPRSTMTVILSANNIKKLDRSIFAELPFLRSLDLSSNALAEVDLQFRAHSADLKIELTNNFDLRSVSIDFESGPPGAHYSIAYPELMQTESIFIKSKVENSTITISTKISNKKRYYQVTIRYGKSYLTVASEKMNDQPLAKQDLSKLNRWFNITGLAVDKLKFMPDLRELTSLYKLKIFDSVIENVARLLLPDSLRELTLGGNQILHIDRKFFLMLRKLTVIEVNSTLAGLCDFYASSLKKIVVNNENPNQKANELRLVNFAKITTDRENVFIKFLKESGFNYSVIIKNSSIDFKELNGSYIQVSQGSKSFTARMRNLSIIGVRFNFSDSSVDLAQLENLNALRLRLTNLETVAVDTLKLPDNVTELDLGGNRIRFVEQGFFSQLKSLKNLNLANNRLVCFLARLTLRLGVVVPSIDYIADHIGKISKLT
jgi:Leucine-rich repeat (LRR) protein